VLAWIVLAIAVVVALLAEFGIDVGPADASFLHWIKHGLIFWTGLVAGVALTVLYYRARRAAG
jgi:uncharacterized membrane protein (DUF441 family)